MKAVRKKQWSRFAAAGLAAVLAAGLGAGCGKKEDPETLLREMQKNTENIHSAKCSLTMDISVEDEKDSFAVAMDMDMEMTEEPYAVRGDCSVDMNISGMDLGTDMEMYQVKEGDEYVSYTLMEGMWSKSTTDGIDGKDADIFEDFGKCADLFEITDQNVTVNGKKCYEMTGNIDGAALSSLLGSDMMRSVSGVDLSSDELEKAKIPCTIAIYKEEILPARITIDLADAANKLALGAEEDEGFSKCGIELTYLEFDSTDEITVPEEAIEATEEGTLQEFKS